MRHSSFTIWTAPTLAMAKTHIALLWQNAQVGRLYLWRKQLSWIKHTCPLRICINQLNPSCIPYLVTSLHSHPIGTLGVKRFFAARGTSLAFKASYGGRSTPRGCLLGLVEPAVSGPYRPMIAWLSAKATDTLALSQSVVNASYSSYIIGCSVLQSKNYLAS